MPIYEYKCQACGRAFEHLHLGGDQAMPRCPACGDDKVGRQLSCFATSGGGSGQARGLGSGHGPGCGSSGFS